MWSVFKFKDDKNNNVEITAPSKTQARNMAKMMMQGNGSELRFDSQRPETSGERGARLQRKRKKELEDQVRQSRQPRIIRRRKAYSRNDRCPCGSGKKVKHCRCPKG